MKKLYSLFAILGLLMACQPDVVPEDVDKPIEDETIPVSSISVNKTIVSLLEGETITLSLTVTPNDATNKNVVWSSSNAGVATVKDGKVVAVKAGNATITATSEDGGKKAMCAIRVMAKVDPSETEGASHISAVSAILCGKVNLDDTVGSDLRVGFQVSLSSTMDSSNAVMLDAVEADADYNYSLPLIGLNPSSTYYYRTFVHENGQDSFGETLEFTSKGKETLIGTLDVTEVESKRVVLNGWLDLNDVFFNEIQYGFIWGDLESDDQYDLDGGIIVNDEYQSVLTGLFPATYYWYTAYVLVDGIFLYDELKVFSTEVEHVQSISLDKTEYVFDAIGSKLVLTATITPADATDPSVVWSSDNESVASVDQTGVVTAIGNGKATITAKTNDGAYTATCVVNVAQLVTSISFDKPSITKYEEETQALTITVLPENANDKTVTWTSSDTDVATVDEKGVVTMVKAGKAIITATANDGSRVSASCEIIVIHTDVVDLGLSVYWSKYNLSESGLVPTQEELGDYYAWGELEPYYSSKSPLTWKTGKSSGYYIGSYKLSLWPSGGYTRYNNDSTKGEVDNKTEFKDYNYEDDAARQTLGGSWRIPTDAEWTELRTKCTWKWVTQDGVKGRLVTGPNGNSIFLPAAGYMSGVSTYDYNENDGIYGAYGHYWSSTLNTDNPDRSWSIEFESNGVRRTGQYGDRYRGYSIRPVCDK